MGNPLTRRQFLIAGVRIASIAPASLLFGCGQGSADQAASAIAPDVSATAPVVLTPTPAPTPTPVVSEVETRLRKELVDSSGAASAGGQWTDLELNNLIDSMGEDSLKRMCKTLAIDPASVEQYASTTAMKSEIRRTILDASRFWPGGDPEKVAYHERVLLPTAEKLEIDVTSIESYDTLSLERAVYNKVFEVDWQSLTESDRLTFLKQSGWELSEGDAVSLAALSGAGTLAGFSSVVKLAGFSFYTGMSSGMHALAASMGITLPFTAYMGMSKAVFVATGPYGWAAAAVLAASAFYRWLRSNESASQVQMLRTVLHLHNYKVSAMEQAGKAFTIEGI